jgi:HEAT repeat protein
LLPDEITYEMIRCVVSSYAASKSNISEIEHSASPSSHIQHIVALGRSKSLSAVPELLAALKSEDGNARRLAASALGKIGDKQATPAIMDLLAKETTPQVRQYAVKALGNIGDPRAIDLLVKISEDENEMDYTRHSARAAIMHL